MKIILEFPNEEFINKILKEYNENEGNLLNDKLTKLFNCLNNLDDKYETQIKVAALNTIYSTAIRNITPVVEKILKHCPKNISNFSEKDFANIVDEISNVEWKNEETEIVHKRINLSFTSKYVHFLSNKSTPIYDSYIWIIIKGYLGQKHGKYSFSKPKNYVEFYETFNYFKEIYNLQNYENYQLDKFLWQYGKNEIYKIYRDLKNLEKSKSELQKKLKLS
ncbi:hypothetical protein [Chryseobacterium sp. MDT2-18]|uniref:hypothetical protein n=1 Tax=Chryseobacterium sp. MDT2-18 TaxID=1259136 RepID=UPI00278AC7DA|nr:hypothetical protein [Chryseobacterium sp. MDT2-18]MDQ0476253.1 hypothetical protein [Chryseobacterium sp. MDT2-18]